MRRIENMILSRRFLRVAALGAVFALGLAGTALAADTRTWTGNGNDGKWSTATNWSDNTKPVTGDTAIIESANVLVDAAEAAKVVRLGDGAKLSLSNALTLDADGTLEATGNATVESSAAGGLTFTTVNQVKVSAGKTLSLEATGGGTIVGAAAALELSGAGTLVLKAPVMTAAGLEIDNGSTLVVNVDNALPALTGTPTIAKGSIVVNAENFGNAATKLTLKEGNLTLKKPMKDILKTVEILSGDLLVEGEAEIGDPLTPTGELTLGAPNKTGHLKLMGNMTLKTLTTEANVDNTITVADGKALTVKADNDLTLNATVTGNLNLEMRNTTTATLNKNVDGKVGFKAPSGGTATLELADQAFARKVDFTAATPGDTFKLKLGQDSEIGTLSFVRTTDGLEVESAGDNAYIDFLAPDAAAVATLKVTGSHLLEIGNGTKDVKWNADLAAGAKLEVGGKDLLSEEVEAKLASNSVLTLPSGEFPKLTLNVTDDAKLEVNPATQNPVLKVKKIDVVAGKTLTMNRPATWWKNFASGNTVALLSADEVELNTTGSIKGNPGEDSVAKIEWKDADKALILTAKDGFKVPVLEWELGSVGNRRLVKAIVSGDLFVNENEWYSQMIEGRKPENHPTYKRPMPGTNTKKDAVFEVVLPSGFVSGILRVKAKHETEALWGYVDVELKAGSSGGGGNTPNTPG
ncbi:hypothetical protein, partial [uncultured Fretibacterium sp.]|uniref:hypothetical protein n=1 Tax=uncultured Fretibacterium sp. TaxID=1678694 RepID=UPI002620B5C1